MQGRSERFVQGFSQGHTAFRIVNGITVMDIFVMRIDLKSMIITGKYFSPENGIAQ